MKRVSPVLSLSPETHVACLEQSASCPLILYVYIISVMCVMEEQFVKRFSLFLRLFSMFVCMCTQLEIFVCVCVCESGCVCVCVCVWTGPWGLCHVIA